jgi:8-oxo-dGTP diphosphatase
VADSVQHVDVVAAIVVQEGRLLITRRPRDVHQARMWEFPGGKREAGESDQQVIERELKEEIDLAVEMEDCFFKTTFTYPERTVTLTFYRCRPRAGSTPRAVQVTDLRWVEPRDLRGYPFPAANEPLLERLVQAYQGV